MDPSAAAVFNFGNDTELNDDFYSSTRLLKHASYFINMIDRAVSLLGPDLELLTDVLEELGRKHSKLGVKPSHFPVMGDALLKILEELLGDECNDDVKEAWGEVYQAMTYDMIRARNPEPEYNIHPGRRQSGDTFLLVVGD
jgi:hemoglobin-like flavoprotein